MGKHYGKEIIDKVMEMKNLGSGNKEIGERFGLSSKQIDNLLTRHKIKQDNLLKGILPKAKGRPKTRKLTKEQMQELEIKRLKTENDLLRSFLRAAGRM